MPRLVAIVLAAFFASLVFAAIGTAAEKPNIIVIVSDDQGYNDAGFQGGKEIPTPNLDALAAAGVRCTSGYVSGPYCSPTRAGLLTGRYQQRYGHEFNPGPATAENDAKGLSLDEKTFSDYLKQAGYATGMVGKWHLGGAAKYHPLERGFQEFYGFLGGAHSYVKAGGDILRGREPVDEQEYLTDAFAREAVAFIDRHQREPFFLYLTFNAVHTPMEATDKYLKRFELIADPKRRTYAAMLSAMDDAIGTVRAKLTDAKLLDNTLIFFVSDNGGPPVNASNNHPLRGHKSSTWEGGIRVPYVVSWPAKLPKGTTYEKPVIQLDFLPTALAAAGVEVPSDAKLDGVNLIPYLSQENTGTPHAHLYWRFGKQMAIRSGDWKLVLANGVTEPQLFNLKDDIGEQTDLVASEPEKRKSLQAAWDTWNAELVEPAWGQQRAGAKKPGSAKARRKKARMAEK